MSGLGDPGAVFAPVPYRDRPRTADLTNVGDRGRSLLALGNWSDPRAAVEKVRELAVRNVSEVTLHLPARTPPEVRMAIRLSVPEVKLT